MPNIDSVQLPDGSNFNIVDNTSNFATQTYVNNAVSGVTKTSIGLGNVDNTSDLNKPVSTAQQTAIDNAIAPKADQTLLAPVESTSTASQTYQIGDQFIYNGLLYKATAVINSGGTINPNGNCTIANPITEQLLGMVKISKLWENPNPSQAFSGQNISLSSGDYDLLLVTTKSGVSTIANKGEFLQLCSTNANLTAERRITYNSDTSLTAGNATFNNSTNNSYLIPIFIYGIKLF